jgi:hypothetical protein
MGSLTFAKGSKAKAKKKKKKAKQTGRQTSQIASSK